MYYICLLSKCVCRRSIVYNINCIIFVYYPSVYEGELLYCIYDINCIIFVYYPSVYVGEVLYCIEYDINCIIFVYYPSVYVGEVLTIIGVIFNDYR